MMPAMGSRRLLPRAVGLLVIAMVVAIPAVVLASAGAPRPATLAGCRVLPANNPWNQRVDNLPPAAGSTGILARIGLSAHVHPDFGTVYAGARNGIPITIATRHTRRLRVRFQYASESDRSRYPLPRGVAIEGGPRSTGDRHVIVLNRSTCTDYELYDAHPHGNYWTAGSGAIFPLGSDHLRPAGWTSADAAGLPIFPGLVRYDEAVEQRAINHALRFTCPRTRNAYVSPARHYASSDPSSALPPMGMRVRLKASFDTTSFPPAVRVILRSMMRYGMLLADNGSGWYVSGAPDPRWSDDDLATLARVPSTAFDVVR